LALLVRPDGAVLLEKRPGSGIWGGLWGLPETGSVKDIPELCLRHTGIAPTGVHTRPVLLHRFTHFDLSITPVRVELGRHPERVMDGEQWLWYNMQQPARVGIAAPVSRLIRESGESVWDIK